MGRVGVVEGSGDAVRLDDDRGRVKGPGLTMEDKGIVYMDKIVYIEGSVLTAVC